MASHDLMENRHLRGRAMIQKKLRQRQEFDMGATLSGKAPIWTKWHEGRALAQEIDKDVSKAPNQNYISVSSSANRFQFPKARPLEPCFAPLRA